MHVFVVFGNAIIFIKQIYVLKEEDFLSFFVRLCI